jgi:hypothetical protein
MSDCNHERYQTFLEFKPSKCFHFYQLILVIMPAWVCRDICTTYLGTTLRSKKLTFNSCNFLLHYLELRYKYTCLCI